MGLDWAAAEGWNPGLHDAEAFWSADPEGFLVGLLHAQPVAMISAVRYGRHFGFIGFYIVQQEFRKQRIGIALWRAAMDRLAGRTIGLDGVVAQQDSYRKSGFELAWNNVRYEGVTRCCETPDSPAVPLRALGHATPELLEYDAAFFPDDRRRFVQHWTTQTACTALAVRRDGLLAGYGVIRPCRTGYKIGPLFADDIDLADRLFRALISRVRPGETVQLDIPATNPSALELVQTHGMQPVFETARMYAGVAPDLPLRRLFGITTFELG